MNIEIKDLTETNVCMQLKGGLFTLTTIQIFNTDLNLFEYQLSNKIMQAPNFFHYAPVVIDLCNLGKDSLNEDLTLDLDFKILKQILVNNKLIPVGVKNANKELQSKVIQANLAVLRSNNNLENYSRDPQQACNKKININNSVSEKLIKNKDPLKVVVNKLINQPVRSGQQIYAPEGDITIIGAVNNGAELLADGSIHVYGALRGRALAGINNNVKARIFCNSLEADLISIAGQFKISDNIDPKFWKKSVQIFLLNGKLEITEFL